MNLDELRAFGQSIVDMCTELGVADSTILSLQAKLDAANTTVDELEVELAALQIEFDTYKRNNPPPATPPPAPAPATEVIELSDFTTQSACWYTTTGLVGKGSAVTTYRMKPSSNTKPAGNLWTLVRATGKVNFSGFTLEGTFQSSVPPLAVADQPYGMEYSGMILGGTGSTVTDVKVNGIPGHGSAPTPTGGETASLSLLRATDAVLTNVHLDGHRAADGTLVAASLFEMNYTGGNTVWNGGSLRGAKGGFGMALYQVGGTVTFNQVSFSGNRKAINIEQSLAAAIHYVGCDFRGAIDPSISSVPYIAQISTLGLGVSTAVTFEDCTFDNDLCSVRAYSTAANSGMNGQKDADIRRIDGGVVVPVGPKFQILHTG